MTDEFVPNGTSPGCARCGHPLERHMVGLHTGARYCPNDPNGTDTYSPRIPPDETLRDRFAMAALAGMLACGHRNYGTIDDVLSYASRVAYEYADAMLVEREKEPQK